MRILIGIDQDPTALEIAEPNLAAASASASSQLDVRLYCGNFRSLQTVVSSVLGAGGTVDGILLDLGVSSMQVDQAERGFSFMQEGALDMRMCRDGAAASAEALVNTVDENELGRIIRDFGEERAWRNIARRIVQRREEGAIRTTQQLVAAIGFPGGKSAYRGKGSKGRRSIHPATRTFQALRIAVNDELGALQAALPAAIHCLSPGGRLAVISFHSLEDRLVKRAFLTAAGRPPEDESVDLRALIDPRTVEAPPATARLITRRPVTAAEEEASSNPRSRSAKLRVLEKLAD